MKRSVLILASLFLAGFAMIHEGKADTGITRWKAFVRVKTAYRSGQVKVWVSDDGHLWNYVSSSAPFLPLEVEEKDHVDYVVALEYVPTYLRVGVTGPFLGRTSVDSIEVLCDATRQKPLSLEPLGEIIDPENASVADGKTAIIIHRGQTNEVNGFVMRFKATRKPPSRRAAKVYFGNYTSPGEAGDRRANAIANWDFTVFQQGDQLEECVRKVKKLNPHHRIVLRLVIPSQSMLLHAYDQDSREALRRYVLSQFASFADLVDTVTFSEEEPGNIMRGIYGSPIVPEAVYLWKHKFERETGKPFVWPPNNDVEEWLGRNLQFMLNDLYDTIKKQYPRIKVYQWVELRGYGNISGFPEYVVGESLKMDGFALEWGDVFPEVLVNTPQGKASVKTSYFERYLDSLIARNHLKPEQILGQVWAFDPASMDTFEQIDNIRNLGISYIYFFWPNAGTPEIFDLFGFNDKQLEWKYAQEIWKKFKPMLDANRKM